MAGGLQALSLVQPQHAIDSENASLLRQKHELREFHSPHPVDKRFAEFSCASLNVGQPEDLGNERSPPLNPSSEAAVVYAGERQFTLDEHNRSPLRADDDELLVRLQPWKMQRQAPLECVLTGWLDPELRRDGLGWLGRIGYRAPEVKMFMWVVSVRPEDLAETEIPLVVIAEREFLVKRAEPLVDEHAA